MKSLEAAMKKHNIHLDTSMTSYSRKALSDYGCAPSKFGCALSSSSDEWLIDSRISYHMAKDKATFQSLNYCNTKNSYVGDDRSLCVVGSSIVHLDNGLFKDIVCVPTLSYNLLLVYQITHSGEAKTTEFTPHQIVIQNLKDPRHVLATWIVMNQLPK